MTGSLRRLGLRTNIKVGSALFGQKRAQEGVRVSRVPTNRAAVQAKVTNLHRSPPKRQTIPANALLDLLFAELALHFSDTNLLRPQIKIRPSSGVPNWDVSFRGQERQMSEALDKARKKMQARYDVEWH
jgi:hypothetical protein